MEPRLAKDKGNIKNDLNKLSNFNHKNIGNNQYSFKISYSVFFK